MGTEQGAIRLAISDLERIMQVEKTAFIPSIQTTEETIRRRLGKGHIYLGTEVKGELVGTLALRFAYFIPKFEDFCDRNLTFEEYAEKTTEEKANAVFIYSIGVVPEHRNAINAKKLLKGAFETANLSKMEFLVGDARVPSYNGSNQNLQYEQFEKNKELNKAIQDYFKTKVLPSRDLIKQDPIAGFYIRVFPEGEVLGITDERFWEGDYPCGGHMAIEYLHLK